MNIEELTIKQIREIQALFGPTSNPSTTTAYWKIGANYFIRTVTHHHTGKLVAINEHELILENAAWIADDGRFAQAVARSEFDEVEPFPSGKQVILGRGSLIDAVEIETVPMFQK